MWIRKTVEELNATPTRKGRSNPFLPILVAAAVTGVFIVRNTPDPASAALIFFLVFYFAFMAKATWALLTSGFTDPGSSQQQDPDSHLFCPDCGLMQSHAALCATCRGPLEPMAHWKWVPESKPTLPIPIVSILPPSEPAFTTTRTIPLTLPTKRMILAAKIGVDEFRILKDLMDENLFAAINPRISDRDVLTSLGRKYRIAFRFVT